MGLGPLQKAWVDALRANPEQQMTGQLGDLTANKFCCLGKLCVLDAKVNPETILTQGTDFEGNLSLFVNRDDLHLPANIVSRYGFLDEVGGFRAFDTSKMQNHPEILEFIKKFGDDDSIVMSLARLNDNGVTWPQIANFIEEFPEVIFDKEI